MEGLGISDAAFYRTHYRLSFILDFKARAPAMGIPQVWTATAPFDTGAVCAAVQSTLGADSQPLASWLADPDSFGLASSFDTTQRWWADRVNQERRAALESTALVRHAARLMSQSSPYAHAWLTVLSSRATRTTLNNT